MGNNGRQKQTGILLILILLAFFYPPRLLAVSYINSTPTSIPDNDLEGTTSTVTIAESMTIADMNLTLNLTHGWIADVIINLTHVESGHTITLINQIGVNEASGDLLGCGLNDLHVTFDEEIEASSVEACQNLPSFAFGADGTQDYNLEDFTDEATYLTACAAIEFQCNADGEYAATGSVLPNDGLDTGLTTFYGEDMAGTWKLAVADSVATDSGTLTDWSITFADTNCGNSIVDGTEECDDGNFSANDGCSAFCEIVEDQDEDSYYSDTDCNDNNSDVHPSATEVCDDDIDNDCDGNQLRPSIWYADADADGYGVTTDSVESCVAVDFHVTTSGDCDDTNSEIYPTQIETADTIDNNCDGTTDEDTEVYDDDGDSFSEEAGDCNDNNSGIYPDAEEACDEVDNNCDDTIDEGCEATIPTEDPIEDPVEDPTEETTDTETTETTDTTTDSETETTDDSTDTPDQTPADNSDPKATAEQLQKWSQNPVRSSVVASGCSLQLNGTPPKHSTLLLLILVAQLGLHSLRKISKNE